ncbi:MAG: CRISPR-associated helicase Cas3' [Thioploca sp.]|nr:CRISPR-associated helicase Cas3' [Thioploca sp.]
MKPLPFFQTLARPDDLLYRHLERVALKAKETIAPVARSEVRLMAFLAGLFHDLGKATAYFQKYLQTHQKTALTPHAKVGAVLSWWYTGEMGLPLWLRMAVFIAVLRHHGQLNYDQWQQLLINVRGEIRTEPNNLGKQLAALDLVGIQQWLEQQVVDEFKLPVSLSPLTVDNITTQLKQPKGSELRKAFNDLDQAVIFLAGWGALLAMDKIDAALAGEYLQRQALPSQAVKQFKAQQTTFLATTDLNQRREIIATAVEQHWLNHLDGALFSLTAPTGSGKTLTIFNAALSVRAEIEQQQGYAPRIIYCLPFTAIIDQNYAVFQQVFRVNEIGQREDLLLKHHHLVSGLYRRYRGTGANQEEAIEHQPDGEGQLLTESWQSEMVVTTFYQLLHSLLSNQNAELKRAGQLSGSLVLMDEIQAIPIKYWQSLGYLFQSAARTLGTRFVLLTATKPLIFPAGEAIELLPHHVEHFQALSRVQLHWHYAEHLTLDDFAIQLINQYQADNRSMLIIVNRIKSVNQLFNQLTAAFADRTVLALSSYLTPRDRRIRLYLIQRLLRQHKPCLVIATQLVEAGVDISFPIVHRELAPLDSVIQSAGRCNRHAEKQQLGEVHLWRLYQAQADGSCDDNQPLYRQIYDLPLIEATEAVLGQQAVFQETDFLQLSEQYFHSCWNSQAQWNRIGQEPVHQWLQEGDFEKIAKDFKLIFEKYPQRTLFIVGSAAGKLRCSDVNLWEQYEKIQRDNTLSPLEQQQAFAKIRRAFYDRVVQVNELPDPYEPITRVVASEATYHSETGFVALPKDPAAAIF